MVDHTLPRDQWPLGRLESVAADKANRVRAVSIRTANGTLERPISKIILLKSVEDL